MSDFDAEHEKSRVEEEIRKRVKPEPAMQLRPEGYAPTTREQSVEYIRSEVQRDLGEEAAKKRNEHKDTKIQEIDRTIGDALSQQQG